MFISKVVFMAVITVIIVVLNLPTFITNDMCQEAIITTVAAYEEPVVYEYEDELGRIKERTEVVVNDITKNDKFIKSSMLQSLDYVKLVNYAYATYMSTISVDDSDSVSETDGYKYDVLCDKAALWLSNTYKGDMVLSNLQVAMKEAINTPRQACLRFDSIFSLYGIKVIIVMKAICYDIRINEGFMRVGFMVISILIVILVTLSSMYKKANPKTEFLDEVIELDVEDD